VILIFELPKQEWPGEYEVERLSMEGCEQRIAARYGSARPVEMARVAPLMPDRVTWRLGDRNVHCAIAALEGEKLTTPIGP
jgi:hypothetical protein